MHAARLPARAAFLALLAPAALGGCGSDTSKFAPPCPQRVILKDAADLHRYRGAGRDITDSVLEGRITGIGDGTCKRDGAGIVQVNFTVGMTLTRGPASTSRAADVPYFVAVTDGGDRIFDKRVFHLRPEFPANTDRLRLSGEEIELRLPVNDKVSAGRYTVIIGFELTPAELAVNRTLQR